MNVIDTTAVYRNEVYDDRAGSAVTEGELIGTAGVEGMARCQIESPGPGHPTASAGIGKIVS
jgi:hypothetical protein